MNCEILDSTFSLGAGKLLHEQIYLLPGVERNLSTPIKKLRSMMNLKNQYKRLFEARVSSNDAKLLRENNKDKKLKLYDNSTIKYINTYESFLNESRSVKDVHLQTRKTKSIKDSAYPFYVIKDYMDVGYWDRVKESDFEKAFDEVIPFLLQPNSNTERLAKENKWMTDYDELWQYQQDKQD